MNNLDRILLFLLGICVLLMSIVTIADPDGYYMQSVEGIIFTCFIGAIGVTMIMVSFFSIYFKEQWGRDHSFKSWVKVDALGFFNFFITIRQSYASLHECCPHNFIGSHDEQSPDLINYGWAKVWKATKKGSQSLVQRG